MNARNEAARIPQVLITQIITKIPYVTLTHFRDIGGFGPLISPEMGLSDRVLNNQVITKIHALLE